jgi:hypothetical protein
VSEPWDLTEEDRANIPTCTVSTGTMGTPTTTSLHGCTYYVHGAYERAIQKKLLRYICGVGSYGPIGEHRNGIRVEDTVWQQLCLEILGVTG